MYTFLDAARRIASEFDYDDDAIRHATQHFVEQLSLGLANPDAKTIQIPSFVSHMPNGTETGTFLAADLGGTNFRVCLVTLYGGGRYAVKQSRVEISADLMVNESWHPLFAFLADQVRCFLQLHDASVADPSQTFLRRLALTFSFTVEQTSLSMGTLLKWDKGFHIPLAIGMDPCAMLQQELNRIKVPVQVAALANDTVGTLLAQQYQHAGQAVLGAVFGTGTNGAYLERVSNITKLEDASRLDLFDDSEYMIVNTEWGGLDDRAHRLPVTRFDLELDQSSLHPGEQRYEKLVSGMYLGEIFRRAVLGTCQLCQANTLYDVLDEQLMALSTPWKVPTWILSKLAAPTDHDEDAVRDALQLALGATNLSSDEVRGLRIIGNAIGGRASRLAGVAIGAVLVKTGCLDSLTPMQHQPTPCTTKSWLFSLGRLLYLRQIWTWIRSQVRSRSGLTRTAMQHCDPTTITIGLDGSLAELYPNFVQGIRSTLSIIDGIGVEKQKHIRIDICKDGSSMGSALIAHAAELQIRQAAPKRSSSS